MPVLPPSAPAPSALAPGLFLFALDILKSAFRMIGVLASGEELPAADANDGLNTANRMLDSWQAERLMVWGILRNVYSLVGGTQTYTLGGANVTATNLDVLRYARVERAGIISLTNAAQPLELPMDVLTDVGWQAIPVKNIQSALPTKFYDDKAFPIRNLNYFPIPNTNVQTALYLWTQITQFSDLNKTQFSFPPAYMQAIIENLAVRLGAEWTPEPGRMPLVMANARESKAVVKSLNITPLDMTCEPMVVGGTKGSKYNWLTDLPVSKNF